MKEISKFQLVLMVIFGACILIGVMIFAVGRFGNTQNPVTLTVWGPFTSEVFSTLVENSPLYQNKLIQITYVPKTVQQLEADLVNEIASGRSPDLFFLPQDLIVKYQSKVYPIPYASLSERDFKDVFIEEGELYLAPDGVMGIPFVVDPLVMFWNRTIFSNAGLSLPPKYWSELYDLAPKLTTKDEGGNVRQSVVSLGEYTNVSNAMDVLGALAMQAGGVLSRRSGSQVESTIDDNNGAPLVPASVALSYYTEFSNPLKPFYSWNRSLPLSKNYFIAGQLALYMGYASEVADIQSKNPNLNFNVAMLPQSPEAKQKVTFGRMMAWAIPKASQHKDTAISAALMLVNSQALQELSNTIQLPPVRRDLLTQRPTEAYMSVFYDAAIQSRAWLQPDRDQTNAVFKEMIESVTGGRRTPAEAVDRAHDELEVLFNNTQ